ncbi:transcription initiation factor IID [Rhypophila sp. PSN 637]
MEPRARAGKNVGKMNFSHTELAQMLYGHGDVAQPLPETVRVLDEIATDFIQGISFEATRAAHHAGRQKVKFEDFEFAMRRNPAYMGKIQEVFEKKKEIENARKNFSIEDQLAKDEKAAAKNAERNAERAAEREEKRREKERERESKSGGGKATVGGGAGNKRGFEEISRGEEDDALFGDDGDFLEGGMQRVEELLGEGDDDLNVEADIGMASKK